MATFALKDALALSLAEACDDLTSWSLADAMITSNGDMPYVYRQLLAHKRRIRQLVSALRQELTGTPARPAALPAEEEAISSGLRAELFAFIDAPPQDLALYSERRAALLAALSAPQKPRMPASAWLCVLQYAADRNWGRSGGGLTAPLDLWVGPGAGPALARAFLADEEDARRAAEPFEPMPVPEAALRNLEADGAAWDARKAAARSTRVARSQVEAVSDALLARGVPHRYEQDLDPHGDGGATFVVDDHASWLSLRAAIEGDDVWSVRYGPGRADDVAALVAELSAAGHAADILEADGGAAVVRVETREAWAALVSRIG